MNIPMLTITRLVTFDRTSQGSLDRIANTLETLTQQQGKQTMAILAEVSSLITANQTLIALVNQLIAKINTPPVPSQDVTDTQAAASSELSAVNAAITAAQNALTPPPQT